MRSGRQAEHLAFARAERANIDAALAWSAAHDPLLALGIVNGFGWAWVVLGDSRGAQRILAALDAAGDAAPDRGPGQRPAARGVDRGVDGSPRARPRATSPRPPSWPTRSTTSTCRRAAAYYLAYVVSHHGEFRRGDGADRSQPRALRRAGPAVGPGRELALRRPGRDLGRRPASAASKRATRSQHWLRDGRRPVAPRPPRRDARRAGPPPAPVRRRRRSTSAAPRRRRDASASCRPRRTSSPASDGRSARPATTRPAPPRWSSRSRRPRPPATCAWRRSPGCISGASCARSGRSQPARAALEAATAWHRAAGGGEQAALGECLLAALDAADGVPGAEERLVAILDDARRDDDAPVEVFALDALARIAAERGDVATARDLCEAADRRMEAASHFITDLDRTDARSVRQIA